MKYELSFCSFCDLVNASSNYGGYYYYESLRMIFDNMEEAGEEYDLVWIATVFTQVFEECLYDETGYNSWEALEDSGDYEIIGDLPTGEKLIKSLME